MISSSIRSLSVCLSAYLSVRLSVCLLISRSPLLTLFPCCRSRSRSRSLSDAHTLALCLALTLMLTISRFHAYFLFCTLLLFPVTLYKSFCICPLAVPRLFPRHCSLSFHWPCLALNACNSFYPDEKKFPHAGIR